jgi:Peptidase family M48
MPFAPLTPLPYHRQVVAYLKTEEPAVWRWASSAESQKEYLDATRDSLLKETYRLDSDAHPALHASCRVAAERLGVTVPVHLYQAGEGAMNAGLFYTPGEAHVVFYGAVLDRLRDGELEALLGHELSHHVLWTIDGGDYHTADRVLMSCLGDTRVTNAVTHTARLYRLYTEAFADRGSAIASDGVEPAITTLVKVRSGLTEVSAASYLRQVNEVLARDNSPTQAQSHPEVFLRARALELWCADAAAGDEWVRLAIQGELRLDSLDLVGQQEVARLTRRVLGQALRPRCLRSESMLAHARRFFPDFLPAETTDDGLATEIAARPALHEYVAALLLDFAVADRELEDVPHAAAYDLARVLGIADPFDALGAKALSIPKRRAVRLKRDAADILARAEAANG